MSKDGGGVRLDGREMGFRRAFKPIQLQRRRRHQGAATGTDLDDPPRPIVADHAMQNFRIHFAEGPVIKIELVRNAQVSFRGRKRSYSGRNRLHTSRRKRNCDSIRQSIPAISGSRIQDLRAEPGDVWNRTVIVIGTQVEARLLPAIEVPPVYVVLAPEPGCISRQDLRKQLGKAFLIRRVTSVVDNLLLIDRGRVGDGNSMFRCALKRLARRRDQIVLQTPQPDDRTTPRCDARPHRAISTTRSVTGFPQSIR